MTTDAELAMQLLIMLEARYPALIHPWDSSVEREQYDGAQLQTDIITLTEERSKKLWLRGDYKDREQNGGHRVAT